MNLEGSNREVVIIPAILSSSADEFSSLLKTAAGFAQRIQLDFMDGLFVPSVSVPVETVRKIKESLYVKKPHLEAHLMVKEPLKYFEVLAESGIGTVIFHFEAAEDPPSLLEAARNLGLEVGLAVNPETEIEEFLDYVYDFDFVMFMTVKPGYYGSPLEVAALDKMGEFSQRYPDVMVSADGGVKKDNLKLFIEKGAKRICVGSAIMKADDPREAYYEFLRIASEKVGS
jgi:ribulose-phosphate 3-epimerase